MQKLSAKVIGYGIVGLILGVLFWKILPFEALTTEVEWTFGDQTLKLNVQKDLSDPADMFKKLFATEYSRAGTLALLNKNKVFALQDIALVEALGDVCRNDKHPGESLKQHQDRVKACIDSNRVITELRKRAREHRSPFQYIGQEVRIGTPSEESNQPALKRANVCRNGGMLGHRVRVINPVERSKYIEVKATGYYECTGQETVPDLQLNPADAVDLFGRSTRQIETAIVVVLTN